MFLKNSWCLTLGWYVIFISNRGVWRTASLVIGSILAVRRAKHDSCRRRCTNLYRTSGVEVNSDASLLFLIVVKRFVIWLCNIGTMIHLWRMWILSKQVTVNRMSNFALGPFCTCLSFFYYSFIVRSIGSVSSFVSDVLSCLFCNHCRMLPAVHRENVWSVFFCLRFSFRCALFSTLWPLLVPFFSSIVLFFAFRCGS